MVFLTEQELSTIGFKSIGKGVCISPKASFHNPGNIVIGEHSRVDDFCVLSAGTGGIVIGKYVHISCYVSLIGRGMITLGDFVTVSHKVSIFSSNDDYSGEHLTNPTIPELYTNIDYGNVVLQKHVIVGTGTIVLPNVIIGIGTAIAALSLVKQDCGEFEIHGGIPAKKICERKHNLLKLEKKFLNV